MALDIPAGPHTATMKPLSGMPRARKVAMAFNSKTLLSGAGDGSRTLQCRKQQILFAQGDAADAVFYIIKGWVKLTVVSTQGKEAVVAMSTAGIFSAKPASRGSGYARPPPLP